MKILHLMLSCFYIDNYSYQENILPKYHKNAGFDVNIIASLFTFDENGKGIWLKERQEYYNEDGIKVIRLPFKRSALAQRFRIYNGLKKELENIKPDVIFMHGVAFYDIFEIIKYKGKHREVRIYADNHADLKNSAHNWLSLNILHKKIWRYCAKKAEPYVEKFYGVLPARVDFLKEIYHISPSKVDLLVLGADDEKIKETVSDKSRAHIRRSLSVADDEILLMTAGKIDENKPEVLNLMQAVGELALPKVKLVVYGNMIPELRERFESYVDGERVIYGGWLKADDTYMTFNASDLMVFPGLHSVYWEQAVGTGCACIFRRITGFEHINLGGNCDFLENASVEEIKQKIVNLMQGQDKISKMRKIAKDKGMKHFAYSTIALKAIENGI